MRRALLLAALLAGCSTPDPNAGLTTGGSETVLDYDAFVCDVMPTVVRRCSYLACHGNADHAFRVYSPGKLRMGDPLTREERDAPLTAAEIQANFESAVGVTRAASQADRAGAVLAKLPLLQKPLQARFGGAEHHGVGIFPVYPSPTPDQDPEWGLLLNWVRGAAQPKPPTQACRDFFDALGVAPK